MGWVEICGPCDFMVLIYVETRHIYSKRWHSPSPYFIQFELKIFNEVMSSHSYSLLYEISMGWKPITLDLVTILIRSASDLESMYLTTMLFWTISICKHGTTGDTDLTIISVDIYLSCVSKAPWSPNCSAFLTPAPFLAPREDKCIDEKHGDGTFDTPTWSKETALWIQTDTYNSWTLNSKRKKNNLPISLDLDFLQFQNRPSMEWTSPNPDQWRQCLLRVAIHCYRWCWLWLWGCSNKLHRSNSF